MKRSKGSHLSSEVVRMGHLMRHIRISKNIPEQMILKEMGLTHASYWAMETRQQRQSFADLMRFTAATQTCVVTNMIASISGCNDLALDGAPNNAGAWAIQLLVKAHAKAGAQLATLDLAALEASFMRAVDEQLEPLTASAPNRMASAEKRASHLKAV